MCIRDSLEAGHYEWNIHLGAQQRRSAPTIGPDERFNEWNAAIERPLRLPGKGSLDSDCPLYTSDAADERSSVDLGGRRIIKQKKTKKNTKKHKTIT